MAEPLETARGRQGSEPPHQRIEAHRIEQSERRTQARRAAALCQMLPRADLRAPFGGGPHCPEA